MTRIAFNLNSSPFHPDPFGLFSAIGNLGQKIRIPLPCIPGEKEPFE
jgi:hypothetical protein